MFTNTKALAIPEGEVTKITAGGVVLWEKISMLPHTNLVPTAKNTDGTILDGIGYRTKTVWSGSSLGTKNEFTAIGLIPFGNGTVAHNIYVYGLDFSGSTFNRVYLYSSTYSSVDGATGIMDGFTSALIPSVTKLADKYFKITTKAYSSKVQFFSISGVTVSGLTPIVTLDEPIF